jgi:hypothetical protein
MSKGSDPALAPGVGSRGRIEPEDGILLVAAPYFAGRPSLIKELRVKEGDWVRSGQVLVFAVAQLLNKNGNQPFTTADEKAFREYAEPLGVILESCLRMTQGTFQ